MQKYKIRVQGEVYGRKKTARKYFKTPKKMSEDCERALAQINTRMYAKEFEDSYDQVFCYGIAFFKKRCLVRAKEEGQG